MDGGCAQCRQHACLGSRCFSPPSRPFMDLCASARWGGSGSYPGQWLNTRPGGLRSLVLGRFGLRRARLVWPILSLGAASSCPDVVTVSGSRLHSRWVVVARAGVPQGTPASVSASISVRSPSSWNSVLVRFDGALPSFLRREPSTRAGRYQCRRGHPGATAVPVSLFLQMHSPYPSN